MSVQSKREEQKELDIRSAWKVNSFCLIYSRSENKWHDGKIEKIFSDGNNDNDDTKQSKLSNEWLTVRYKNEKKTKKIQRNCADIKPIPTTHNLSLRKGSKCLIWSHIIGLWCEGKIISVFKDADGEWLRIKYYDTNEHKICDIQRFSKDLQTFKRHLLWTSMIKTPTPNKPWIVLDTNNFILPPKLSNILQLNNNEFIVAAYSFDDDDSNDNDYDENENEKEDVETNGIYKFNITQKRWELWIAYPRNFFSQYHNICMDYTNQIIYLFSGIGGGLVWKIYIKTKKFECLSIGNLECFGAIARVIGDKFNIFYGNNNNNHLLFDEDTKQLQIVHRFELPKGLMSFGMIYNEIKDYYLFFGGYNGKDLGRSDEIWKYAPGEYDNPWVKLDICMPDKMQSFGSVITSNCEFVIILGGSDSDGLENKIYVLDLMSMKWSLSKVVCPYKGIGFANATIVTNRNDNNEYIHLIQGMYSHIKISLSDILKT